MSTGIDTAGALTVVLELDAGELEQPAMRPAVRREVRARRWVIRVRTFMVVLRKTPKMRAVRHHRRVYAGVVYGARRNCVAIEGEVWDNYVMRSTRDVVQVEEQPGMGHYSDPPLLVLASLASGPKHGHAMIEDIAQMCGSRLGPGTLYGAIARLEQQGWIAPLPPEERRRPYRITVEGLRVLRARLTTLHQFSTAGLGRLEPL
jgi:DNA-binding PadR family transcriptional regulator